MMTTPILAEIAGNLHVALAAVGAAIGIGLLGSKAAEATGRNPGAAADILKLAIILAALMEGIVFFAIYLAK
jgi:F-type H+-transporting ATPase subunit c